MRYKFLPLEDVIIKSDQNGDGYAQNTPLNIDHPHILPGRSVLKHAGPTAE